MDNNNRAAVNGLSIAGLVFGIFSIIFSVLIIPVPFFFGLSVTFSLLSRGAQKMNGLAKAGLVLSAVSVIVALGVLTALFAFLYRVAESILEMQYYGPYIY